MSFTFTDIHPFPIVSITSKFASILELGPLDLSLFVPLVVQGRGHLPCLCLETILWHTFWVLLSFSSSGDCSRGVETLANFRCLQVLVHCL